jgi:hypothetical protein
MSVPDLKSFSDTLVWCTAPNAPLDLPLRVPCAMKFYLFWLHAGHKLIATVEIFHSCSFISSYLVIKIECRRGSWWKSQSARRKDNSVQYFTSNLPGGCANDALGI